MGATAVFEMAADTPPAMKSLANDTGSARDIFDHVFSGRLRELKRQILDFPRFSFDGEFPERPISALHLGSDVAGW